MATINFTGWESGFEKVEFTKLLRHKAGLSLAEAKTITDALVDGQESDVVVESSSNALEILDEATRLGAKGVVISEAKAS